MKWFKFYGSDWLTDIKVMNMSIEDRLCFLTLLCLAANDENPGVVKGCDEEAIIKLTHLYEDPYNDVNEVSRARGFLKRFIDNKMITIDCYHNVSLVNFDKRQSKNLSGYERVKRCRERKKLDTIAKINDDNNDNAMITQVITSDKNRIDKNRIEKNKNYSPRSLELAKLLYKLIKDNNPSWYLKPNFDKWAEDIDKIIRLNKRTAEQVEWMIRWAQNDNFWSKNILSPSKLREKFNDLVVRAKSNNKGKQIIGLNNL